MVSARQAKIFLIKDRDDKSQIADILRRHSYAVIEVTSTEFSTRVRSFPPDLILFDTSKYRSLISYLRNDPALSSIPVVLIADIPEQIEMAALEAGITDFLREPIREAEIIARVRQLLAMKFNCSTEDATRSDMLERTEMLERALRGQGVLLSEAREASKLWEATFDAMADVIVITDAAGRITMANSVASDVFHQTREELLGKYCGALLMGGVACPHIALLEERVSKGQEILSRAGDRLLNVRASRFLDAEGQAIGFVHVFRDVTRERALERHLMQAERMSLAGLMVSAVAHEVATPLSVISNIAEMLLMDVEPDSPSALELNKIVVQARRVAEMMRSILNFVRQKPAQFSVVDLGRIARETLGLLEYELRRAHIQTTLEISPTAPLVWGDTTQLQQVLLNLVTNAIQVMKDGGQLTVRISEATNSDEQGPFALLIVEDTGSGITPEALERLFDFFFTTKLADGGTGLGLAISKQIVEGHGGTITAENLSDRGARFLVRLPAAMSQN